MSDLNILSCFEGGQDQDVTHVVDNDPNSNISAGIIRDLIPEYISECALYTGKTDVCVSHKTVESIGKSINATGSDYEIMSRAKQDLNCNSERCVLEKLSSQIGRQTVEYEIIANLKVPGPTDNKLLSNVNIDAVLSQWRIGFSDFFPYNFNMLNYASYSFRNGRVIHSPDTLATIRFDDLYNGKFDNNKYKCVGCVINSDVYQGVGKHWMALFADARSDSNDKSNGEKLRWTVEFFNSSGNSPAPEWVNWMVKTRNYMEELIGSRNIQIDIVKASSIRHQKSKSECGLYSLFYIWARLNGVPVEYFKMHVIPDRFMFEFRQHIFADKHRPQLIKFNWDEYKNITHIEWEKI